VPVEFVTDAQVAAYGGFGGVPPQADLDRSFVLDDVGMTLTSQRRGEL
jgi:hypothetical protein